MAPTFIIHTESWINSVNYSSVGPILTEAKDTCIKYSLNISPPSPLLMQWLCFSHSSFPFPSSNIKTNFPLHDSNSCCSLYSCICLLYFTSFSTPFSRVIFLLCFSYFISPHPVISPSNRKIQSHFRQHASPSLPWRHQGGWHHSQGGSRLEEERVQFFIWCSNTIFYLFVFLFDIVFLYIRLWWNGSECPSLASSAKSQLLSRLLSKSFPCPLKSKKI